MRVSHSLSLTLLLSLALGIGGTASFAKSDDTAGRAGSWNKAAQGAPDLKAAKAKVDKNPKDAEALNDYGFALRQNGQTDEAAKFLKQAIEIKPAMGEAHANLSVVYFDQGKFQDAVAEGQKAVKANADQAIFRVVLGNALAKTGDLKGAQQEYKIAIQLKPNYENAYYNLGVALNEDGQINDAKYSLSKALELDPNDDRVVALLDKLDKLGSAVPPAADAKKK